MANRNGPIALDHIELGDCLELLRTLPDEAVDLIISSPPYNLGKEYEARRELDSYLADQTVVLAECARVLKQTGSIFWQVGAYSARGALIPLDIRFFPILESLDLIPRNRIVWTRQHGLHGRKKFSCRHETLLWFTKSDNWVFNLDPIRVPQKYQNKKHYKGARKGEYSCNPIGKNPGDIWMFQNVKHNHQEQTIHPCQFPEDLVARVVLATTNEGDVVLDPYMGAGTVAVVAREHGRRYVGAELDAAYHSVALRRLSGEPDESNAFPNLKTLRAYVARTGANIERFRFDVQVGDIPSQHSHSRIFPEPHHLTQLEERIAFEEASFAADLRGVPRPDEHFPSGRRKDFQASPTEQPSLFDVRTD